MAGLVGYINKYIKNDNPSLASISQPIKYVENDPTDQWEDGHLAIARVHHGKVNPEKQPVFNEDKSLLVFMDGEIYGYEADKQFLLARGHRFRYAQNDAEFCLHLYEELAEKAFVKLNGSFLIVIYNLNTKELILVNDRFSSCPLFYCTTNEGLIFASQLKAIIQFPQVQRELDLQAIFEFFTFHKLLGTRTYYKDIKVLFPATFLRFRQGEISLKQYWEIHYKEAGRKSKKYYVEALADALKTAVRRRTADDRRYGILLSGGLDSRAILAASDRPMTAFTIADFENNEVKIAKKIAAAHGCKHVFLQREADHYPNAIEKAVEIGDGMFSFQHAHFIGFLERIKDECDILLHGCALGALFQGPYLPNSDFHFLNKEIYLPMLSGLSEGGLARSLLEKLPFSLWEKNPGRLFEKNCSEAYETSIKKALNSILKESRKHAKNYYNQGDYFVFQVFSKHFTYLNELCIKPYIDDRRVVFDIDLFDLYLELPPELRFNGRVLKQALKKLDPVIANIPNANTGVSPTVSEYIEWGCVVRQKILKNIRRPKLHKSYYTQGSWPEMAELIRKNEKLRQFIWDVIHDDGCINPAIFNRSSLVDIFNKHLDYREDFTWFFYLLLTFGVWHKKYGP